MGVLNALSTVFISPSKNLKGTSDWDRGLGRNKDGYIQSRVTVTKAVVEQTLGGGHSLNGGEGGGD